MATEPTCDATTTIIIGDLTEADVTCGKEPHGEEEAHFAKQTTVTKGTKTKPSVSAQIIYVWR